MIYKKLKIEMQQIKDKNKRLEKLNKKLTETINENGIQNLDNVLKEIQKVDNQRSN